ncbi:MAG: hypothetical protein AAB601_00075 [Patescibacteria group bacterium]
MLRHTRFCARVFRSNDSDASMRVAGDRVNLVEVPDGSVFPATVVAKQPEALEEKRTILIFRRMR